MGGIDASIALNAGRPQPPAPFNMLANAGQAATTANALIGLQNNQAQLAARTALAGAYSTAPRDPVTGMPNQAAVLQTLAADPRGSWMMPQVIQGLQAQQKAQYDLNAQAQAQTISRLNTVNGALNPLLRMGSSVTPQDIFSTIAGLHASGLSTDELVNDAASTLPSRQPGMTDQQYGQALSGWVVNHASRSWSPDTQGARFTPTPTTVDTGGQIVTRDVNPYTSPSITTAPPINRTLSPGEQVSQVPGPVGPQGQKTVIPQAGYAAQNGMGSLVPGAPPPSPFGANGGRYAVPAPLRNPNYTGVGQAPPAAASAGGGGGSAPPAPGVPAPAVPVPAAPVPGAPMATSLPPAQQTGLDTAAKASADAWAAQQNLVGGSASRIYQLRSALTDLKALGPTGTGPSAGTINSVKSYLQSLPLVGQSLGVDPNNVANYDLANKYLTAYASARAGARGGTTDSQLATTLSSNASTHISNLAAQDVVKANIGLERMDQAQMQAFQNGLDPTTGLPSGQHSTPDQYSDFSSRWNTAMDPRAFVADQISPQQFGQTVAGMQPNERARFQSTFNTAVQNGWIEKPAWMTPAAPAAAGNAPPPAAAPAQTPPPAAPPATPDAPVAVAVPAAVPAGVVPPLSVDGAGQPAIRGY